MKRKQTGILSACLAGLLMMAGSGCTMIEEASKKTVGTDIRIEDITEFYYTEDGSSFPPYFQRYRFYAEAGKYAFSHETREGDHWPLTQDDATVTGTLSLSEEEWAGFFEYLKDGTVTKREDDFSAGDDGPWLYLYWKNDRDSWQVFAFASYSRLKDFETYCESLRERQLGEAR